MNISDLITLKKDLERTKVAHLSNDGLRKYLKLSLILNKYNSEFEERKQKLGAEAAKAKGYDMRRLTEEEDRELIEIIVPVLNEYLNTEVDIDTKILSWDDLYNGILDIDENISLPVEVKSRLTTYLCTEEL